MNQSRLVLIISNSIPSRASIQSILHVDSHVLTSFSTYRRRARNRAHLISVFFTPYCIFFRLLSIVPLSVAGAL